VIPVFLGLLWLPFLRSISKKWTGFFLSLTIGLLIFLGVDALEAALETASLVPAAYQGLALILMGLVGTPLVLAAVGRSGRDAQGETSPLMLSTLIALGIGLHNLGEGLAVGGAYASGEIALGTLLVVGFLLHNTTEGLGIVSPIADTRPSLRQLATLGFIAGAPTILGAWIGGFSYSPIWLTIFFAVGAGAIVQVVYQLWRFSTRSRGMSLAEPLNALGIGLGLLILYATGLFVAV
jgi:zinc transporter ZupT